MRDAKTRVQRRIRVLTPFTQQLKVAAEAAQIAQASVSALLQHVGDVASGISTSPIDTPARTDSRPRTPAATRPPAPIWQRSTTNR